MNPRNRLQPVAGTMWCSNAVRVSHPYSASRSPPVGSVVATIVRSSIINHPAIIPGVSSCVANCMTTIISPIDPPATHNIFKGNGVQILVHFQVVNCDISHDILHVM